MRISYYANTLDKLLTLWDPFNMANSEQFKDWLVVIPSRMASTRLPRKALADIHGKPMVERVYHAIEPLRDCGAKLVVATDHQDIYQVCSQAQVPVAMTSEHHQSGTERVAEVSQMFPEKSYILNVQGDEPFVNVDDLKNLMNAHQKANDANLISTLVYRSQDQENFLKASVVKAVIGKNQKALYFSRSPIPHDRKGEFHGFWHHLGVYAYSQNALRDFCRIPNQSILEATESLEQLRWLDAGYPILTVQAQHWSQGIDTPEDLEWARNTWKNTQK